MRNFKFSKKQIVIQLGILAGLGVALYLVLHPAILRSLANSEDVIKAVEVKDASGNTLECPNGTCETKSLDVHIRLNVDELNK